MVDPLKAPAMHPGSAGAPGPYTLRVVGQRPSSDVACRVRDALEAERARTLAAFPMPEFESWPGRSAAAAPSQMATSSESSSRARMPAPAPVRSVYVHAPFCSRRCAYCDFAVHVRRVGDLGGWERAIEGELRAIAYEGRFPLAAELDTLYVGGGTPSLLGAGAMTALAEALGPERLRSPTLEWTAEANPESFTADLAAEWRRAGVNRVSLGVQSFHGPTLAWLGRMHGPEGAREAVATARTAGLTNLSLDLMFGLPQGGAEERDWERDLDRLLELAPPHVSLYGLSVEPTTPLARTLARGRVRPASEERYRDEYLHSVERLTSAGYLHYEVSSFCLPGRHSCHNRVYWEGGSYLGLGNAAHSFSDPLRRWNVRDWEDYAPRASRGELAVAGEEEVGGDARRLERVWLGLRTDRGLPWDSVVAAASRLVERWLRRGWARREGGAGAGGRTDPDHGGGRLRLTAEGWLLLDRLTVELDLALARAPNDAPPLDGPGDAGACESLTTARQPRD